MSIRESAPRLPGLPPMNRLLSTLSVQELGRIKQQLIPVNWEADHIILEPMEPVHYVWFPETCVVSLSVALEQGITCEAGIIGSDGVVGYEAFLGNDLALSRYVVQVAGIALQLPVKSALSAFTSNLMFHDLLMHCVSALHAETLQSVACHGLHTGRVRLARFLLQIQDHTHGSPVVNLTHEMLANVLGVQRTTVTAAAMELQQEGLISYRRGRIEILDRAGLELAACECYGAIRANFERLMPHINNVALAVMPCLI